MSPTSYLHAKCLLNDMLLSNKDVLQKMIFFKVMACIFTVCQLLHIIYPGLLQTPKKYALFIYYPHFKDRKWRQKKIK